MSTLWKISTTRLRRDAESIMRAGNVYQIANGFMGYRGTLDEYGPAQQVGITLAGLFDQVGRAWREPVNAPNGGYTQVLAEGVPVSALDTPVMCHRQSLDLANATFSRDTVFRVKGGQLRIRSERFLSAANPNLGVIRFHFGADHAARLAIHTGIDGNIWDLNGPHLPKLAFTRHDDVLLVSGRTAENRVPVAVAEAIECRFGHQGSRRLGKRHLHTISFRVEPGRTYTFYKYFAVVTGRDAVADSPAEAAVRIVNEAKAAGYAACLAAHNERWQKKWAACDVLLDGDTKAQQALRYSLFQLLIAAPVAGSGNSIPARALSGQVYKGAIFWDTEMFMFPFFVHTAPEVAAELLRYRIRTLDGARRKARGEGPGYRGAFYAWESQETGDDACTYFNIGDPLTKRELRTHFRDKQVHISGDIALAMWEYFRVTGDDRLLREGGAEVILECARFYRSYAYFQPDKQRYEILDVIGPDEYHERVNNNAYTSMVARATFEIAQEVLSLFAKRHPAELDALLDKLKIRGELDGLTDCARRLYVPAPDAKTGVIEQFDGYFKLRESTPAALHARKLHPDEYLGAGQGLAVPTRVLKQADVVLMLNLFPDRYPLRVKRANWEFYEPRTEHGSSLSACAYAMQAVATGKLDFAYRYFMQTARIDLEAKYKVFVGTVFMGGSHPAANGGAWMTAIFGFAGLRATPREVILTPHLYRTWKKLEFPVAYRGARYRITITPRAVTVAGDPENAKAHTFTIAGQRVHCAAGEHMTVQLTGPRQA